MPRPKNLLLLAVLLIPPSLLMTACGAQNNATPIATSPSTIASPIAASPIPTSQRPIITPHKPIASPWTAKYRLLNKEAQNGHNLLFCDPDMFPVGVSPEGEMMRAKAKLPEIQNNQDEYQAILQNNNLSSSTQLSDDQILLVYRDSKKLDAISLEPSGDQYKFVINISKAPDTAQGDGTRLEGLIDGMGTILSETEQDAHVECPICLAGDTQIATPNGPVPIRDLRQGMPVWTLDTHGVRRAAPIAKTTKRIVPSPHEMLHIVLSDGREMVASSRHPTVDGQLLGSLTTGDTLDNSPILKAERIPYYEAATYDILPSGETGFYWANDILVASTLAPLRPFPRINNNNAPALHLHALHDALDSRHE